MNDDLQERLDAAKAKIEASKKRATPSDQAALEAEVEEAERDARDEDAFASAIEKHGRRKVSIFRSVVGAIVLRTPNHLRWRAFLDGEKYDTQSLSKITRPCIVYPSADEVDIIFEDVPDALTQCANLVADLAKGRARDVSGK